MYCYLMVPSHYLKQCRFIMSKVLWYSYSDKDLKMPIRKNIQYCILENHIQIPRDQWVKGVVVWAVSNWPIAVGDCIIKIWGTQSPDWERHPRGTIKPHWYAPLVLKLYKNYTHTHTRLYARTQAHTHIHICHLVSTPLYIMVHYIQCYFSSIR